MSTDLESTWFENPQDGQRFRILSLPGPDAPGTFVLEYIYRPFTGKTAVPPHFHSASTETCEVLSGSAQRVAFALLARLGARFGYRTSYPAYGTLTAEGLTAPTADQLAAARPR